MSRIQNCSDKTVLITVQWSRASHTACDPYQRDKVFAACCAMRALNKDLRHLILDLVFGEDYFVMARIKAYERATVELVPGQEYFFEVDNVQYIFSSSVSRWHDYDINYDAVEGFKAHLVKGMLLETGTIALRSLPEMIALPFRRDMIRADLGEFSFSFIFQKLISLTCRGGVLCVPSRVGAVVERLSAGWSSQDAGRTG
jgi:hypothetical protein